MQTWVGMAVDLSPKLARMPNSAVRKIPRGTPTNTITLDQTARVIAVENRDGEGTFMLLSFRC